LEELRLAISFRSDPTAVFLEKASQELAFWRMTLREAQLLGTKMSALAAIRWANDFLSTLMRERQLDASDLTQRAASFVRSQARRAISAPPSCPNRVPPCWAACHPSPVMRRGWFGCAAEERNLQPGVPGDDRTHASAFITRRTGVLRLQGIRAIAPRVPLGARYVLHLWRQTGAEQVALDAHQFPSRVHDEEWPDHLLLLQAEIEERPDLDVGRSFGPPRIAIPTQGNHGVRLAGPTLGFACLETASHPPEPGDQCKVALGQKRALMRRHR
jgi:hypothetical protein